MAEVFAGVFFLAAMLYLAAEIMDKHVGDEEDGNET